MLPMTSVCTNSKRLVARRHTSVKGKFLNLALLQASHFAIFSSNVASFSSGQFLCNVRKTSFEGCPKRICQSIPSSSFKFRTVVLFCRRVAGVTETAKLQVSTTSSSVMESDRCEISSMRKWLEEAAIFSPVAELSFAGCTTSGWEVPDLEIADVSFT